MLKIKSISAGLAAAMLAAVLPCGAVSADTSVSETQFFEDFESYGITEKYNSSNMVYNAAPKDGVYDATVYPYGTASVYEGNAANNVTVLDYAGNTVAGGLDGWWGYLSGPDTYYNQWNRRLSVYKLTSSKVNASEINNTQFLKLEPKASATHTNGRAYFERQNVDLDGYSLLSTRINISGGIYEAGLAITMNPADQNAVALDVLTFTKAESDNVVSVNFGGASQEIALSAFNDGTALDWYTIEYRINRDTKKHSLLMVNDSTKEVVFNTDWTDMPTTESFAWSDSNKYGIRYYVNATYGEGQTRLLLDDIKFTKESFTENFSGYNTKFTVSATASDTTKRIVNAPNGNTNLSVYANGAYEGALQKNNYMYRTLADETVEKVYGNVPFWQGYIAYPSDNPMTTDKWAMRCNVMPAGSNSSSENLGFSPYYGYNNIIHLSPKTDASASSLQAAYAGMESADFAEGTVWTTNMLLPDVGNADKGTVKLQLTKGRSIASANGKTASYDGNSHSAYLDVLEIDTKDGSVKFAGEAIADVTLEQMVKYEVSYTVNRTGETPAHSIRIKKADDGTVVMAVSAKEISNASFFEGDMVGFRYAVTANAGQNAKAVIRTVKLQKFFGETGFTSAEVNTTVDYEIMSDAAQNAVLICAAYNGEQLVDVSIEDVSLTVGKNKGSIAKPSEGTRCKLMLWNSIEKIKPLCESKELEIPVYNENLHIYLCIGQSNMAGRAAIEDKDQMGYDSIYLLNGENKWEAAGCGMYNGQLMGFNRYSTTEKAQNVSSLSLSHNFAKTLANNNSDIEIGIVSNAVGGVSIDAWMKGASEGYYESTLERVEEAMKYGQLKGIIWHQGESDQETIDTYMNRLQTLITDLRTDLGNESLPFVAGQLLPKYTKFNEIILTLPQTVANTACVTSKDTVDKGDELHFDSASARLMGQRYAEAMSDLVY